MSKEEQIIEEYLHEIQNVPSLTNEDVRQLIQSRSANLQRITQAHLNLVVPIAKEFAGQGKDLIELVKKGNLGLIQAVETFDLNTQGSFSDYATRMIRDEIAQV